MMIIVMMKVYWRDYNDNDDNDDKDDSYDDGDSEGHIVLGRLEMKRGGNGDDDYDHD